MIDLTLLIPQLLPLTKLEKNKGQIKDVKANPRIFKDEKFKRLVKSIEDNPEMLALREIIVYPQNDKFVVIGGNARYEALKYLKIKDAPCKVLPVETTPKQMNAYIIKDNASFGDWDWDMLANEWDLEELQDYGIDMPDYGVEDLGDASATEEDDFGFKEPQFVVEVVCKDEAHQNEVYSALDAQGYEVRFKMK